MRFYVVLFFVLQFLWRVHAIGPTGVISAVATHSKYFGTQVQLVYFEAVNCTIEFDQDVFGFNEYAFTKENSTRILNFQQVTASRYEFQAISDVNANVSMYVAQDTVKNAAGVYNDGITAIFFFQFYAYAPSLTLRLDGYSAQSTKVLKNLAYIVFNSTTDYNGTSLFNESFVMLSPFMEISNFAQVNDVTYSFKFEILLNSTSEATASVTCVNPDGAVAIAGSTQFLCSECNRPQLCQTSSLFPPDRVSYLEWPFEVVVSPIPGLGTTAISLPFFYDTLWAEVDIDAPSYATAPFYVTVTWTEPLQDLLALQPAFASGGPPIDQDLLKDNLTILSPRSFRLLIAPLETGILTMSINGTYKSVDSAGNTNDYRRNTLARTGDQHIVVFSAGPPLKGSLSFAYDHPSTRFEYQPSVSSSPVPSLSIAWSGFVTAVYYDLWVSWGKDMSTTNWTNLTTDALALTEFRAMLGVEYTAHLRAVNFWGEETLLSQVFVHPGITIIADGTYPLIRLPDLLSTLQTNVSFHAILPPTGFLSLNALKVLSLRTIDKGAGDQDPCEGNSARMRCTYSNFHIEVPATQFVVFREAIRLQFTYGRHGWSDIYYRPQLRYWEEYKKEWRSAADTCPPQQAYENWNDFHKIYAVSICHLSQFSVFEYFSPLAPATTTEPPPRPKSYTDPTLFVAMASIVVFLIGGCCTWYWACVHPSRSRRKSFNFDDVGIRPVTQRIPSRRVGAPPDTLCLDDAQQLLPTLPALPAPSPSWGQPALPPPPPPDGRNMPGESQLLRTGMGQEASVTAAQTSALSRTDEVETIPPPMQSSDEDACIPGAPEENIADVRAALGFS